MRILDRMIKPRLGATVRELLAAGFHTGVLGIQLADPRGCLFLQRLDLLAARCLSFAGHMGIVRNDQAQIPPRQFANGFRRGRDAMRVVEGLQQLSEFAVAPTRYGQHEFQRLTPVQTNFRQGVEVSFPRKLVCQG